MILMVELDQLLKGCFVVIDKPRGPPSAQVGSWVRGMLGADRNGHIGTLDPGVSGVLIVAIGKAVKLSKFLSGEDKEYIAIMRVHKEVDEKKIRETMAKFVGAIKQKPPLRSAVAKRVRERTIHEIEILEIKGRDVLFRVRCEGGTYIRKLIFDIGKRMGCGANMLELRRVKSGWVGEEEAHTLYELKNAVQKWKEGGDGGELVRLLVPADVLLHLKTIKVKDSVMPSISYGSPIYRRGLLDDGGAHRGEYVKVYSKSGAFCGVARVEDGPELFAKMDVNWLDAREFKKMWKEQNPEQQSTHSIS